MALPTPTLQLGDAAVLIATRDCLRDAVAFEPYLDAQVAGLAALGVTVALPLPVSVEVGTYDTWRQQIVPPSVLIQFASRPRYTPDDAGQTYQVEAQVAIAIALTEGDTGGVTGGDVYLAATAYANAVAYYLQRWLSSLTYGGAVGIYECVIADTGAESAAIEPIPGMLYRVSETSIIVRYQTIQEPPEVP